MKVHYKNQSIKNPDNIDCQIIDVEKLNFDDCPVGCKSTQTLVKRAKGGERIYTYGKKGEIESTTIANQGDAIFCNSETDVYIPSIKGKAYEYDNITSYGYDIISSKDDECYIKSNNKALLLVGVIDRPSCIKDAFGEGNHQFLFEGATLKKDLSNGMVSGISKKAFETTWEVFDKPDGELGKTY